jgi:hypothetical protein
MGIRGAENLLKLKAAEFSLLFFSFFPPHLIPQGLVRPMM